VIISVVDAKIWCLKKCAVFIGPPCTCCIAKQLHTCVLWKIQEQFALAIGIRIQSIARNDYLQTPTKDITENRRGCVALSITIIKSLGPAYQKILTNIGKKFPGLPEMSVDTSQTNFTVPRRVEG